MRNVLFIFEGEKAEPQIIKNIQSNFFDGEMVIYTVFGTVIYKLWKKIKDDPYIDLFEEVKSLNNHNKQTLSEFIRTDFSEIYLFFDYDGHASNAKDSKLADLLEIFYDEYETGKLYINYPMVESLKDFKTQDDLRGLNVKVSTLATYKGVVSKRCKYKNFTVLQRDCWQELLVNHCSKANLIVNNSFSIPDEDIIPQNELFLKQVEGFITPHQEVSVVNSFPLFLMEYFGRKQLNLIN
jgi:hypothetical protein